MYIRWYGDDIWLSFRCSSSIAAIQYKAGRRDLLWVAQLQTAQLASESNVIKLRGAQRANRVRLYQALRGSFDASSAATVSTASPTRCSTLHDGERDMPRGPAGCR